LKAVCAQSPRNVNGIVTALRSVDPRITMRRFSTGGKDGDGGGNGDAW
jgi:hypothetical protein